MTDTASSILLTREQSTGSNVNLWGGYLITTQRTTERASKGYQAYTVTGDATISWTNYSASNDFGVAFAKLNGAPAAAWALTLPSYQTFLGTWNNSGKTGTFKNAAGTGVAVPTGRRSLLYGDATDIGEASPNWLSNYASTLMNAGDIVVKTTLDTTIAAAAIPGAAGTVKVDAGATAGYLFTVLTDSGDVVITDNGDTMDIGVTVGKALARAIAAT